MLHEWFGKVKARENDILLTCTIFAVAIMGFALGRISAIRENQYKINTASVNLPNLENPPQSGATLVGSKEGAVYHLLTCPGAKSIKEDNKIYFATAKEAEKAGYRPAANCPGL